jgi:hypothetical protein
MGTGMKKYTWGLPLPCPRGGGVYYIPLALPEALLHFCALLLVCTGFSLSISAPRVFPFNFEESRLKNVISLQNKEMLEQLWLATWVRFVH